ncbi:uncharacterized protein [Eleutherodactylus coqui]|uniref:uncharacterized protein n=1 Tax=Eleutherodactylus coqui TaxID=57060 RepID=UPI0034620057
MHKISMDSLAMRDYIKNFSLDNCPHGNQGYNRVLLQLFGYAGHGKSCFINSCKYVVDDGPYKVYAKVAKTEHTPETMIRKAYVLTDTITLVDNRGFAKMNKNETGEIYAQLGNFLPLDTEVKWHSKFNDMLNIVLNAETQDQSMDLIVPVFVYSAKKRIPFWEVKELRDIIRKASKITGLLPTVVITNELSEHLNDIREMFRRMGVKNIFSVENYTEEDHLKTRGKHEEMLGCLYGIIKDVELLMRCNRDPFTEKIERKRILYAFAHERDMEIVQDRENNERWKREESERREQNRNGRVGFRETVRNVTLGIVMIPVSVILFAYDIF